MLRLALLTLSLFFLGACHTQKAGDRPFRTGTIFHHPSGQIAKARLIEPHEFQGLPCRGWVRFFEDGTLHGARLAETAVIGQHRLPEGTYLWFTPQGELDKAWLSRDTTLGGLPCKGGGKIEVGFHPGGAIRTAFLDEVTTIDGIPCRPNLLQPVRMDTEGRLLEGQVAEDTLIDGHEWKKGEVYRRPRERSQASNS